MADNPSDSPQGSLSSPADDIFNKIAEERKKNEALLSEMKKLSEKNERFAAMSAMGGTALAGSKIEPPKTYEQELEEKAEQLAQDAVKRMLGNRYNPNG